MESRTGQALADRRALLLDAMVEACRGNVEAARSKGKARLALSGQADDSPALIRSLKSLGLLEPTLAARKAEASRVEPITRAFEQKQGLPLIRRPPLWSTLWA